MRRTRHVIRERQMASILLGKELLSFSEIWPDLLVSQMNNSEVRPGSRVAVLHASPDAPPQWSHFPKCLVCLSSPHVSSKGSESTIVIRSKIFIYFAGVNLCTNWMKLTQLQKLH